MQRACSVCSVINSVIVKSSKLTRASKVYRGISGGLLPERFWEENEQGVKGGVCRERRTRNELSRTRPLTLACATIRNRIGVHVDDL